MFEKIEILIIIFSLLLTFYLVISWGSNNKKGDPKSQEIKRYLSSVRILIIIIV